MSRAEQAFAFCSALLGGPEGDDRLHGLYATLWTSGDKRTRWRRADEPGAVSSLVAELDEQNATRAVYICTTLHDQPPDDRCDGQHPRDETHEGSCVFRRPKAAESAGLVALWAEFDIAGEGHESANLPATVEQAMRIVEAMRLRPTLVVHSGGGLHCWWVLTEPWLVRDAGDDPDAQVAERAKMATLERDWVAAARYHGDRLGRWKVDPVHDLARLLRPAGTTNRKQADSPRPVRIVEHNPEATYNPSDFEEVLPDTSVLSAYVNPTTATGASLSEAQAEVLKQVNLGAVWARVNSPAYVQSGYLPEWLAEIIELEAEGADSPAEARIGRTWRGERPDLKDDQNRYDAALMRLLADLEVDTEGLIEALMCRRLRTGETKKVNPQRRLDYVVRTVARFRAEANRITAMESAAADRMAAMAAATLGAPDPRPEPEPRPAADGTDGEAADEAAFTAFTEELIEHRPATDKERAAAADEHVRAQANGGEAAPRLPGGAGEIEDLGERGEVEAAQLAVLTDLLIPQMYRDRGVEVWAIEYRDYGHDQRGRLLLRLPIDFGWPVQRPSRYRPGRLLPTEWWRRDVFDRPAGFQMALERDCLIISRDDAPKADWATCIRTLVPLWRKDSSGADLASHAHEWLFDYLMLHHGTGEPNEVGAQGRPWVKETRGWTTADPPVIYVGRSEFLEHCRRQPGAVVGRAGAGVLEYLKLVKRRPRVGAPGMGARQTWYEIEPAEFSPDEWAAIIEVTRHSYNVSAGKRGLRAVRPDGTAYDPDAGVGIDDREAR
jgi:hypothetical protein